LWPQLTEDIPQNLIHFQQDGAPPYYHRELRQFLVASMTIYQDMGFGERDQSLGLRRYQSLTSKLLLLGVCQRTRLHSVTTNTVNELKEGISETIEPVNAGMLRRTMQESE
jgi:hypothetical protein